MSLEEKTKESLNYVAMRATQYGRQSRRVYDTIAFKIINDYQGSLTRQNLARHYYNCIHNYEEENLQG